MAESGEHEIVKGAIDHFAFQVKSYNKVLNANRSYVSSLLSN